MGAVFWHPIRTMTAVEPTPSGPSRRHWAGFWSLLVQQTQNAFNDKMAQFILIPLGGAIGIAVESWAAVLISLPFVLFAPLAGWMSDRYSKRTVVFVAAVMQTLVLAWICAALWCHHMPMALSGFFLIAVQAALFSPAKMGLNKELLGSAHLGFSSGAQQALAMLGMLSGQILAGWWFDVGFRSSDHSINAAWMAALIPMLWLLAGSVPTLAMPWVMPPMPAQGGSAFSMKVVFSHGAGLRDLWSDRPLRLASWGAAFFWGFAAFINLWSVKVAKELTGGGEGFGSWSSAYMAAASLGMAGGCGLAAWLLRKRIELGWVPLAGLVMAATCPALALLSARSPWFFVTLILLAFAAALFLAPLNAWMQDRYPAAKRGELQSAANLQDCFAGVMAAVFIELTAWIARSLGMNASVACKVQIMVVGAACLLVTLAVIRLLPADFIRILCGGLFRSIYHIRVSGRSNLPEKGGVLMLPNHVTFVDAFLLSAACDRPIRFVMDEAYSRQSAIRWFTSIFATMTIRRDQPLEAIRAVMRALRNGDLVCLFPEGQLTRTGSLCTLQRGFELIARKTGHPLMPVWVDGSWGSVFSFSGGRFFWKWPCNHRRGVTVACGTLMESAGASTRLVQLALLATSAAALERRFFSARSWAGMPRHISQEIRRQFRVADPATRKRWWVNGHQLGMFAALPRGGAIHVWKHDPLFGTLPGLFSCFPHLYRSHLVIHEQFDPCRPGTWVGGEALHDAIQTTQLTTRGLVFLDFGATAHQPIERDGLCHCPCLAVDGIVVALSMPHPPPPQDAFEPQHGHKLRSRGKLLPGFAAVPPAEVGGIWRVMGPSTPPDGLPVPGPLDLDEECFWVLPSSPGPRH